MEVLYDFLNQIRIYQLLLAILAALSSMVSLSHQASGQTVKSPSKSQDSEARTYESEVVQSQNIPSVQEKTVSTQEPGNVPSSSWIMYSGYSSGPPTLGAENSSTSKRDAATRTANRDSLPKPNAIVPIISTPEFSRNQKKVVTPQEDLQVEGLNVAGSQELKVVGSPVEGSNQPTNLQPASLQPANLQPSTPPKTKVAGSNQRANLQPASLQPANLQRAKVAGSNQPANLQRANLQPSTPPKTKVAGSNQPANLQRANLQPAPPPAIKVAGSNKAANLQPATHLNSQVAQTQTPSPTPSPQPATPNPQPTTPEAAPSPQPTTPDENQPQPRVLVGEVLINSTKGELPAELQNQVYQAIRTRPGRTATRDQLQEDVKAIYATGYFARVDVRPEDTPLGVRVTFVVEPNPVLQSVSVTAVPTNQGSKIVTQQVVNNLFGSQYGRILNFRDLQASIQKLNQYYKDKGYDLAQVIDVPQVSDDGRVTLVVAEGVIENIQVRYINKDTKQPTDPQGRPVRGRTRPFIITREIALKPGDVFNRQTAQNDLRRVYSLGIFEDVQLSFSPGEDPRRVNVIVDVIERNTGSIAAGAGFSSSSGLFGTLSYQQQNLGGNNQKLGGEVQVGQRELLFDLNFTDPWIAGDPYRTSYTVDLFRRQTISLVFDNGRREVFLPNGDRPRILRYGSGVTFTRPLARNPLERAEWIASLGLEYQRVSVLDGDGNLSRRDELGNLLSFSRRGVDDLTTLQLGVSRDLRDDALRPIRGSLLRLGVEQSVPIGSGSILLNRVRGSYSYYIPVRLTSFNRRDPHQTLAFNLQAGSVIGDLPPYEAFALGGVNSVRGYDEGALAAGRSFVQATAEYRFPLFSIISGALFFDYGTSLGTQGSVPGNPGGVRLKPGSGYGYGLGVRVQSPLGPIRIDYGINDRGNSRIHFGIGERF